MFKVVTMKSLALRGNKYLPVLFFNKNIIIGQIHTGEIVSREVVVYRRNKMVATGA